MARAGEPGREPFWSVVVPTHDCDDALERTLRSVREQDPGPEQMQIAVVDDASRTDRAERITRAVFGARAEWHHHAAPRGLAGSWNACLALARGRWVHLLHQDDWVLPGFYERLGRAEAAGPDVGAAFCRSRLVDAGSGELALSPLEREAAGVCEGWLERIAVSNRVQCPAVVVRRAVYRELGGFRGDLSFALDWEMWVRIASHYRVWYEPEPLAVFRSHGGSETARLCRSGENVRDLVRAIDVVAHHLPPERRAELGARSREYAVNHAFHWARRLLAEGDRRAARAQLDAARALDPRLSFRSQLWNLRRRWLASWLRGVWEGAGA